MAPGGIIDQDSTIVPGGIFSYLHQAVPHYPLVSSSSSLHCAVFLFHLSVSLSLPFIHHLLAPHSGAQDL